MKHEALVYCENEFGEKDGKTANGLVRKSDKYKIVGVIDSSKEGLDAGEYLDGKINGIPIFNSIDHAIENLKNTPTYFIYGIAPLIPFLNEKQRKVIFLAMERGMNIINGLPEYFNDNPIYTDIAIRYGVTIQDVRKPPKLKKLHNFTGKIRDVKAPVVLIQGTDCAVGKRTTSLLLVDALKKEGIKAVFVATGQTGLMQGAKYGIAVDVLTSGYAAGEVENAILNAYKKENPEIIIVEGQGALGHPAFTSSAAIIRGAMPDAIILQHSPYRNKYSDYINIPILSLEKEIEMIQIFSTSEVISITINNEYMTNVELKKTIENYELEFDIPTTDVLKYGCDKLKKVLFEKFPKLSKEVKLV
ncbi:DUF1611 domain-containing protein [Tenacibaculum aiptasiae]|uniref:DUF1611 domain-containing protein n=1 Tax=Tenacibaculum aiptasiae TaxID=426481 RepID=UPI00232C8C06|nr:DUF1611 domain-containing protein [Tenacibaculum aiptasiae]